MERDELKRLLTEYARRCAEQNTHYYWPGPRLLGDAIARTADELGIVRPDPVQDDKLAWELTRELEREGVLYTCHKGSIDVIYPAEAAKHLDEPPKLRLRDLAKVIDLHPAIRKAAESLFDAGHYSEAVEKACLAFLNVLIDKVGRSALNEAGLLAKEEGLLGKVLSEAAPILAINAGNLPSEVTEQEGYKHLALGLWKAMRCPRAHPGEWPTSAEEAAGCIVFASMLAKRAANGSLREGTLNEAVRHAKERLERKTSPGTESTERGRGGAEPALLLAIPKEPRLYRPAPNCVTVAMELELTNVGPAPVTVRSIEVEAAPAGESEFVTAHWARPGRLQHFREPGTGARGPASFKRVPRPDERWLNPDEPLVLEPDGFVAGWVQFEWPRQLSDDQSLKVRLAVVDTRGRRSKWVETDARWVRPQ